MADVEAGAGLGGEEHVAGDDRLLGDGGPAGEPELGGDRPLVQLGAAGEAGLLRVLGDHAVHDPRVLERAAHEQRIGDARAVVAEDAHRGARPGHRDELRELAALPALRDGADGPDLDVAGGTAERGDLLDDAGRVGHRVGVRHGVHDRVAAGGRGAGAGQHGLRALPARFAQMGVQVDEAGQRDQAVGVDHPVGGLGGQPPVLDDPAVPDAQVGAAAVGGPLRTADQQVGHAAPLAPASTS